MLQFRISSPLVVLGSALSLSSSVLAADSSLGQIKTIFAFGDSWTSIGYNPANDIDNIDLYNTTSGGSIWLQYLAKNYSAASSSYHDFASVGATINNSLVFSNPATDFAAQVGLFETYFANFSQGGTPRWIANDTLFSIWFGNDDLYNCVTTDESFVDLVPQILASFDQAVGRLYSLGARNFLFLSLPELSLSPLGISSPGANTTISSSVRLWNDQLFDYVSQLSNRYDQSVGVSFDAQKATQDLLEVASRRGYKNVTNTCEAYSDIVDSPDANDSTCDGALRQYFWKTAWNPTFPVHESLSTSIAKVLKNEFSTRDSSDPTSASSKRASLRYPLLFLPAFLWILS